MQAAFFFFFSKHLVEVMVFFAKKGKSFALLRVLSKKVGQMFCLETLVQKCISGVAASYQIILSPAYLYL